MRYLKNHHPFNGNQYMVVHKRHPLSISVVKAIILALIAFELGMLVAGYMIKNKKPLLNPLDVGGGVTIVYASNEIPKEQTRWYKLYQKVRWYESNNGTKGLAVTCANKGKINEIGYLPKPGYCFDTRGDQENTFAIWINKRINFDGLTDSQLLCLWNTGVAHQTCPYSVNDLKNAK